MKRDFLKELGKRPLVFDGATGTMLQRLGLKPGGCPDELVLKEPSLVKKVHSAYKDAGADVVSTNTFGANRVKLKEYGLESKVGDINTQAARLARQAVGDGVFVAGDIGPTGHFMEPVGTLPFDEAVEIFVEQAISLKAGGADLIVIETMMDLREMKAALMAAKSVGLPVVATMTFDETMRTVLGTSPEAFVVTAEGLGADAAGANCSLGVEGIYRALLAMSRVSSIPLMAQPNAGIPALKGADTVFPASPDDMAAYAQRLAEAGVRILGGCCGTTPEHISRMARAFKPLRPRENAMPSAYTKLSSRTRAVVFGGGLSPVVVGERINPTGRKTLAEEIRQGKTSMIRAEAREQEAAGADALDVNVGVPGIDEPPAMKRAVFAVNENSTLPVVIDSSSPEAVEEGLKAVDGKALINSISGEEKKLREILPLARKYGAALLALALDDAGIPQTAEGRLKAAEAILKRCLDAGIRKEDILVDCLAMTVSAEPNGAVETLKAIRLVKERLGLSTALGVSNISFGLPCREAVNSSFLSMAVGAGLDVAIINPKNKAMADAFFAARLLSAKDAKAEKYIRRFSATGAAGLTPDKPAKPEETVDGRLKKAVIEGDCENIVALVQEALDQGQEPLKISNGCLIPGLDEVGRLFAANVYYLPQVMQSADAMKKAFERLKKELKGRKGPSAGKVLLATVEGDIHDIGKNIVATLLENHGFEVIDLGKNVPAERIISKAVENRVDIVGLSALMTTTVMEMDKVIRELKKRGIEAMTIVGGAVVTKEFSDKIGADEYGGDALSAIEKMKRLVERRRGKTKTLKGGTA